MALRSVHFTNLDTQNVLQALTAMRHDVSLVQSECAIDSWLSSSTIFTQITDAIAELWRQHEEEVPIGHVWRLLPRDTWDSVAAISDSFQWGDPSPDDLEGAILLAQNVIAGSDTLEDDFADPVVFLATLMRDSTRGWRVATLLEAISLITVVIRNGGEMIWNRYTPVEKVKFSHVKVRWQDGRYFLSSSRWRRFNAWKNSKTSREIARVLRTTSLDLSTTLSLEPPRRKFVDTDDVATAALWLGVTIREVRINVLRSLLEPGRETERSRYIDAVGVDLADLLALGWETGIHSHYGRVVTFGKVTLTWPSLCKTVIGGYTFLCVWGLTREDQKKACYKQYYHYLRGYFRDEQRGWRFSVNHETYVSHSSILGRLFSVPLLVVFWSQHQIIRNQESLVNVNDAWSRMRRTGKFVETADTTTVKPQVSPTMLKALSDRIPVNLHPDAIDGTFGMCFGDKRPGAGLIRSDEIVLVLSYRHASAEVRMHRADWRQCYADLSQVAVVHGKAAMRVWTDRLASLTRGDAKWVESGVEPYRNAIVVAFNGSRNSVFVDRFWLSLERNTGLRSWGYWIRDDCGQLIRLGTNPYPARTEDRSFLTQILFTPGRADGALWEEDRLEVVREAGERLNVRDNSSLWDAMTWEFLPRKYVDFMVVSQKREAGERKMKERGWSPASDVLVDRELLEKAFGFSVEDQSEFEVRKWMHSHGGGNRWAAVKSKVSEHWFLAKVEVVSRDGGWHVEDVLDRRLLSSAELDEFAAELALELCEEEWDAL